MAFRMAMFAMLFLANCRVAHSRRARFEKQARSDAHIDEDDNKEFAFKDKADQVGAPVHALYPPAALAQEDASQVSSPAIASSVNTPEADTTSDSEADSQADFEMGSEIVSDDSESHSDAGSDGLLLECSQEDPEGLCLAVQELLEPMRGIWFIKHGGSKHQDYDEVVEPRVFCLKVAPRDTVQDLIKEAHVIEGGHGDEDKHKPHFKYFKSSYRDEDLLKWFECVEEVYDGDDDVYDNMDGESDGFKVPTCEQHKEHGRKLHSLFAEHGKDQFSYRLGYEEGLVPTVITDGVGVVTASGFAVGIEASLVNLEQDHMHNVEHQLQSMSF